MKKHLLTTLLTFFVFLIQFLLLFPLSVSATETTSEMVYEMTSVGKVFELDRIVVKFKDGTPSSIIERKINKGGNFSTRVKNSDKLGRNEFRIVSIKQTTEAKRFSNISSNLTERELQEELSDLRYLLTSFLSDPNVEFAEPIYARYASSWSSGGGRDTPNDFNSTKHWYYDDEFVREMWQDQNCDTGGSNCGGKSSVTVAVIDTGLAYENRTSDFVPFPAFFGPGEETNFSFSRAAEFNSSNGFRIYNNNDETNCNDGDDDDGNGYIDDCNGYNAYEDWACSVTSCSASQRSEQGHPNDDWGHGTYVSGGVASAVDNGSGTSISPAHNITLMPIKGSERITHSPEPNISGPTFWSDDICASVDYARLNGADVINLSLGAPSYSAYEEACINDAFNAGIVIIAASGNSSSDASMKSVSYPAANENVIAVGSSDNGGQRAYYSNGGSNLDLVAAVGDNAVDGNSMWQVSYDGNWGGSCSNGIYPNWFACEGNSATWTYEDYSDFAYQHGLGTSYASPQVAAATAIILGNNPGIEPIQVRSAINASTSDTGTSGYDNATGHGIINFELANKFDVNDIEDFRKVFPVYRWTSGDRAWVWVGNTSNENAVVELRIAGELIDSAVISPGSNVPLVAKNLFDGPVEIYSNKNIYATLKARTAGNFMNEFVGIDPTTGFGTEFYYPVYRWVGGDKAWIWIGNTSGSSANITIEIAGESHIYQLADGELNSFKFEGIFAGPVKITSDRPIFTTLKTLVGGGINEMPGISPDDFSTEFYFPVYRWAGGDRAWIWVGNASGSDSDVTVSIGGSEIWSGNISNGANVPIKAVGVFDGPVEITSTEPVYASLKSLTNGVIDEFAAISSEDMSESYLFPVYRWAGGDRAWIWIGNASGSNANVTVSIGGSDVWSGTISHGSNVPVKAEGLFDGPVVITSSQPVYATLKSRVNNNINEFLGIH